MNAPERPHLAVVNGHATTTSNQIAEHFGKRHDHVLRAIKNLGCSPDFRLRNFGEASIEMEQPNGGTAKYPAYTITRDGFVFLAMGFTGKEAAQWKEAYIEAFNAMEATLQQTAPPLAAPTSGYSVADTMFEKGITCAERAAHQAICLGANMLSALSYQRITYAPRVACYTAAISLINSAAATLKQERARLCQAMEKTDGSAIGNSNKWPDAAAVLYFGDVAAPDKPAPRLAVKGGAA